MLDFRYEPQCRLELRRGEVPVWLIDPLRLSLKLGEYRYVLDTVENNKIGKFHFAKDKISYFCCHVSLRLILGLYRDARPPAIEYDYNQNGKPFLRKEQNPAEIFFNLSHTSKMIAVGLSREKTIGIDVEIIDPDISLELVTTISTNEELRRETARLRTTGQCFDPPSAPGFAEHLVCRLVDVEALDKTAKNLIGGLFRDKLSGQDSFR